ncbi:MAG TPA: DUF885 family protein, partial [Terriglobales bacterium]
MKPILLVFLLLSAFLVCLAQTTHTQDGKRASTMQRASDQKSTAEFNRLADRYFDEVYFKFSPSSGTAAGFHQYDPQLEDYSRRSIDAQISALKSFQAEVEKLNMSGAAQEDMANRELVLSDINSRLLTLQDIRPWEKNPDIYSSGIASSAFVIMARQFAPPDERLKSLISRERQMPAVFTAARENLKNPPRIYTEIAIEQLPGIVDFFKKDVPEAFKAAKDRQLLADFAQTNQQVIQALESYQKFLQEELLPKSNGDFRLGAENYRKKLLYDEMVDIPLDRLLEIGMADLRKNQDEFKRVAREIDPNKTPEQILRQLEADHPAPDKLLQTFRNRLAGLRDYIVQRHIIDVPSPVLPILEETPPFMRALTMASMDTPGPYERVAKEAYFNVTLPEASWQPERIEEHMAGFNRGTVISTAIHEVYP